MTRRDYVRSEEDGGGVVIHWDSELCIHSGVCVQSLPPVFNTRRRPWVNVDGADSDEIAATVAGCPSGALTATTFAPGEHPVVRTSAQAEAQAEEREAPGAASVSVKVLAGGPYLLKGEIEIVDGAGQVARRITKVALCRCGHSRNKPFCDGSHHTQGFADPGALRAED